MAAHNVNTLIYSSTCATYGEPETMPIVETTTQVGPLMLDLLFSKFYVWYQQFNSNYVSNQFRTLLIRMERQRRWQRTSSWISQSQRDRRWLS